MPRYIDANNIRLTGLTFTDVNKNVYFSLSDIRKAIEQTPTEDVEKVTHGEWMLDGRCSECLENPLTTHKNYCPHCGAKMDGERKEQG